MSWVPPPNSGVSVVYLVVGTVTYLVVLVALIVKTRERR